MTKITAITEIMLPAAIDTGTPIFLQSSGTAVGTTNTHRNVQCNCFFNTPILYRKTQHMLQYERAESCSVLIEHIMERSL